ncbi:MAG: GNAT family N-acetyltransferase [Myxococcales bacterium]
MTSALAMTMAESGPRRLVATWPERAVLADATRVMIRPIEPGDAPHLQAGLLELSERTRYLRFHGPRSELSAEELRFLTEVDGENHFALVAFTLPRRRLVGVGRFIRLASAPEDAELALVVVDDLQGKGLGEMLLLRLRDAASERGVARFTGSIIDDNRPMRALLRKHGGRVGLPSRGVCNIELALP